MRGEYFEVIEVFKSIQGEGTLAGIPAVFIRLAKCNRKCPFCDTKYAREEKGKKYAIPYLKKLVFQKVRKGEMFLIIFTGGEPLLQYKQIIKFKGYLEENRLNAFYDFRIVIESNGDLLLERKVLEEITLFFADVFGYGVVVSPKSFKTFQFLFSKKPDCILEFKILHDGGLGILGKSMSKIIEFLKKLSPEEKRELSIPISIMPLTTGKEELDKKIKQKTWEFCVKYNYNYSPRLQIDVWGMKRGV